MHFFLFKSTGEQLDIATTAVNVLFMLDSELDIQSFSLIAEFVELG